MGRSRERIAVFMLLAPWALVAVGCATTRLPAIDPSGERILLPSPNYTTLAEDGPLDRFFPRHPSTAAPLLPQSAVPTATAGPGHDAHRGVGLGGIEPAFQTPETPPPCGADGRPPLGGPCYPIGSPSQASLDATLPGVSPIGSGLEADDYLSDVPAGVSPVFGPGVVIHPRRLVAPVGREVVLVGGIQSRAGHFRHGELVRWSLSQDSAGTIVDAAGHTSHHRRLALFDHKRRRLHADFVETRTAARCDLLHRDPQDPQDDIYLSRGQTWVSLTSGSEGISYVTLAAPDLGDWNRRQQTASVIWVDGQWSFPPPTVSPASAPSQLITYVSRQSDSQPISGWVVRYSTLDGVPAALDPEGSAVIDILTDSQGRAVVDVYPLGSEPGTTRIGVQIIKPKTHPGEPAQILIGEGQTSVTWTGGSAGGISVAPPAEPYDVPLATEPSVPPGLPSEPPVDITPAPAPALQNPSLSIKVQGPTTAPSGEEVTYDITVRNAGPVTAEDVRVSTSLPETGLQFLDSIPRADVSGRQLEWRLGSLLPDEPAVVSARFRLGDAGRLRNVFYASAANASPVNDGVTTTVTRQDLRVTVSDPIPGPVEVGQEVTFNVTVLNLGDVPLDVTLVDEFDPGLEPVVEGPLPADPTRGIRRGPFPLPPGPSDPIPLTFRARRVGTHEHRVVVTEPGGGRAQATGTVRVIEAERPAVGIELTNPERLATGSTAPVTVTVQNTGDIMLTGMQIEYRYDRDLFVTQATDGHFPSPVDPVLTWTVDPMPPDTEVTIQLIVQAATTPSAEQACNSVTVTSSEGVRQSREFCVEIDPAAAPDTRQPAPGPDAGAIGPRGAAGTLDANVESRSAVARVNEPIEYVVTIRNNNDQSYRSLVVTLQIAPGMEFTREVTGPPGTQAVPGADPLLLQFTPVGEVRPNDVLTYEAVVVPRGTGTATLVARVDAAGLTRTLATQAQIPVN